MEEHEHHVCLILEKFQEVGLYAKLEKCEFYQSKLKFLGYVIFGNGIHMNICKAQIIVHRVIPTSIQYI
jgi:hypothetical protein